MKTNIKTLLFAAALMLSSSMWGADQHFPKGKYYFSFEGVSACQIDIFNDITNGYVDDGGSTKMAEGDLTFDSSNPLNENVNKSTYRSYSSKAGSFTYLAVELQKNMKIDNGNSFFQFKVTGSSNTWLPSGWQKYTDTNLTNLGTEENKIFYGKVTESGIVWQKTGPIPSTTPILTFTAGANGAITTATAGGETVTSGDEDGVAAGTSVRLVATPNTGYAFYGWQNASGDIVSSDADYTFSMPSAGISLTAIFYVESTDPSIIGCDGCFRVAP